MSSSLSSEGTSTGAAFPSTLVVVVVAGAAAADVMTAANLVGSARNSFICNGTRNIYFFRHETSKQLHKEAILLSTNHCWASMKHVFF